MPAAAPAHTTVTAPPSGLTPRLPPVPPFHQPQLLKTEYDTVRLLYNRFVSAISQKPTIATVLSPDVSGGWRETLRRRRHPAACCPC